MISQRFTRLMLLICLGAGKLAKAVEAQSYVQPMPTQRILSLEHGVEEKEYSSDDESVIGLSAEVVPYYQASYNALTQAHYFGYYNSEGFTVNGTTGVLSNYNFVYTGEGANALDTAISFAPERTVWGVDVWMHKDLSMIHDSLSWEIFVPIAHVTHDVQVRYDGTNSTALLSDPTKSYSAADFFAGRVEQTVNPYKQQKLQKMKINGKRSKTGVADVTTGITWRMHSSERADCAVRCFCVIPTSNVPTGEYMYEPTLGNNGHWGVGGALDTLVTLYADEEYRLYAGASLEAMYLFSGQEERTVGYIYNTGRLDFVWYALGGQEGVVGTFPLANLLTQKVAVRPGAQVKGTMNFQLWNDTFGVSCAYTAQARAQEHIKVKHWPTGNYAVTKNNYNSNNAFSVVDNGLGAGNPLINAASIYPDAAASSEALMHTFHLMVSGKVVNQDALKCTLSLGCDVSLFQSRGVIAPYTLFGRVACSF